MIDPFSPFEDHVSSPRGRDALPDGGTIGAAGGSACGDLLTIGLTCSDGAISSIGFEAAGCAALTAAGSAVVELVGGAGLLEAARVGRDEIDAELGGLSAERAHVNVLAEEALHRALGMLVAHADSDLLAPAHNRKLVGLSGGVDSAVAAELLKDAGDEAVGITLQLWDDPTTDGTASCCSPQAVTLARRLAHDLDMPHFTVDLRDPFRKGVVDPYLAAFGDGLTPNPCVGCNGHVRFDALDEMRLRLGASKLATGHYARIVEGASGRRELHRAVDHAKDQSYVLGVLDADQLSRAFFPLGDSTKPQVREEAAARGFSVARKPDSHDICFIPDGDTRGWLAERVGAETGEILDRSGAVVGTHEGAPVGQRRRISTNRPSPAGLVQTALRRVTRMPQKSVQKV